MDEPLTIPPVVAIVVIGRNEGDRLKRCLQSLPPGVPAIYVDSGSTDDSLEFARSLGVVVAELDMRAPFTAARARNLGWRKLLEALPDLKFVQFVDGDCEVSRHWISRALDAIASDDQLAAVFGRRRERFPACSIYNTMCDDEWDAPLGLVEACGGDVLFRVSALMAAGGYSDNLIAGEEPDLCLRLRQKGWRIRRIEGEMTLHDAAITSFGAHWTRTRRSGFAYAEHVWRHGRQAIPSWRRQLFGILFWGLALPIVIAACVTIYTWSGWRAALVLGSIIGLSYPLQILRVATKKSQSTPDPRFAASYGLLIVVGKFAQVLGVLECWNGHILRRDARLIEYKQS